MAGKNCSYWHCQRLRPPLQRSPFWIPDLPVASSLFAFPSPNARLHAPSTKATGDESALGTLLANLVPRACDPLGRKRRLWDNP